MVIFEKVKGAASSQAHAIASSRSLNGFVKLPFEDVDGMSVKSLFTNKSNEGIVFGEVLLMQVPV